MLDPKKLMLGRELQSGYWRHEEGGGRQTYSVEVREIRGWPVYFEAVTSQTKAMARATELAGCFADCTYIGALKEKSHAP